MARKGEPFCCFDCVQCTSREYSNDTGLFLPLPPKVDGGYVFSPVCLSVCLFAFLSACEQDVSKKVRAEFISNLVDRLVV